MFLKTPFLILACLLWIMAFSYLIYSHDPATHHRICLSLQNPLQGIFKIPPTPSVVAGKMNCKGIIQRNSLQSLRAKTDICQSCWFRAHYIKQQAVLFWISIPVWGLKPQREYLHVLVYIWVTLNVLCRVAMEGYLTTNRWGWFLYVCVCACSSDLMTPSCLDSTQAKQDDANRGIMSILGDGRKEECLAFNREDFQICKGGAFQRSDTWVIWRIIQLAPDLQKKNSKNGSIPPPPPPPAMAAINSAECLWMCTW